MSKFALAVIGVGLIASVVLVGHIVEIKYGTVSTFIKQISQRFEKKPFTPFRDARCETTCHAPETASEVTCNPLSEMRMCLMYFSHRDRCFDYVSCVYSEQNKTCEAQVEKKRYSRCVSCIDKCEKKFRDVYFKPGTDEKINSCVRHCTEF